MKIVEYFIPRLNGWLSISLDTYISLLFSKGEKNIVKLEYQKAYLYTFYQKNHRKPKKSSNSSRAIS
jgi:hypothetical protein